MQILILHNRYRIAGGEDESVKAEFGLLKNAGFEVELLEADNDEIGTHYSHFKTARSAVWSRHWKQLVTERLNAGRHDLMHVHNFFPLISPSVFYSARRAKVPVIQTIHNYRIACPSANLFRNGAICDLCVGRLFKTPGIMHRCYRGSALATLAVANISTIHKLIGTWNHLVDRYIAISKYVAETLKDDGIPAKLIEVMPNFVTMDALRPVLPPRDRRHVLFVGRLVPEKGLDLLMAAWAQLKPCLPLKIVGEGPNPSHGLSNVQCLGRRPPQEVYELMREAACVVMPGRWPEPFGRVAIEAFACGTPVITADSGGVAEMVLPGINGRHFRSGDANSLAQHLSGFLQNRVEQEELSAGARASYLQHYTPEITMTRLLSIYSAAISSSRDKYT